MQKKLSAIVVAGLLGSVLTGCGGSSSEKSNPSITPPEEITVNQFAGIWHLSDDDQYLEISETGNADFYECSVNNGYRKASDVSISLQDDQLTIGVYEEQDSVTLSINDNLLTVVGDKKYIISKSDELPESCSSDAIDIISLTPSTATVGEDTLFNIDLDYRLDSTESAELVIFATENNENDSDPSLVLIETIPVNNGTENYTTSFSITPEYLKSKRPFQIWAELRINTQQEHKRLAVQTQTIELEGEATGKLPSIAPAGIENLEVSQDSLEGLWLTTINVEGQRSGTLFGEVPVSGLIELALQGASIMRISGDSQQGYTYTDCSEDGESQPRELTVEGDQIIFTDSETEQPVSATITNNVKMTANLTNISSDDDDKNPLNLEINTATANSVVYKVRDNVDAPIGTLQISGGETIALHCMDVSWVSSSAEITGAPQTITTQLSTLELSDLDGTSLEADWLAIPEIENFDLSNIISSFSTVDFNYADEYFYDETINLKAPESSFLEYSEQGTVTIDDEEIGFTLNIDLK